MSEKAEQHAASISRRFLRDEATLGADNAELRSLVQTVRIALVARDFERLEQCAQRLTAWLRKDYVHRSVLVDTVQLLYYFIAAFGGEDARINQDHSS